MNIVIAGYGVEGRSNARYFAQKGHTIAIADEHSVVLDNEDYRVYTGADVFGQLDTLVSDADMVVRTAGLSPHKLVTEAKVWSATNEFFQQCPAPIIGVTGSKGKGTTCSLIASILRASGKTVHLVGNIGVPALDVLPQIQPSDVVVYELSSFQLWDVVRSPHIAVVLHIEPDHLDVHANFDEYISAKARIVAYQDRTDVALYHPTNNYSQLIAEKQPQFATHAAKYASADNANTALETVYAHDGQFVTTRGRELCSVEALRLPGRHNIDNAAAAISACLQYDSGLTGEQIAAGLNGFAGLDHRLKYVDEVAGVQFYDDSIATTPGSAIAAIESFIQPKVLILGGSPKGAEFDTLAQAVADAKVRHIVLIGEEASHIARELDGEGFSDYTILPGAPTMSDIVTFAAEQSREGDVVILSPACASFGMFKNYSDRGDQFIAAVQRYKKG